MRRAVAAACIALLATSCTAAETFSVAASAPFVYQAFVDASLDRFAVAVTITNHSEDDLLVNPGDLALRDRDGRIYVANLPTSATDARLVRLVGSRLGLPSLLPLSPVTLRKDDTVAGFLTFDLPAGTRPVELVFRQVDTDRVVELPEPPPDAR